MVKILVNTLIASMNTSKSVFFDNVHNNLLLNNITLYNFAFNDNH
jgi:hypothetical protein